ncbi:MAG TPA: class I SAM-dependent rRNA methyltransferase [Candidatus Binatia bacterium]
MLRIILKKGREGPVLRGHPWVFSGAIEKIEGGADVAGLVDVFDWENRPIARGLLSPKSQIRVRILTWQNEEIDAAFFSRRISRSLSLRQSMLSGVTNAFRIVNGEGDFLPGLIVDRYNQFLVCQFLTAGMEPLKPFVVAALSDLLAPKGIFEKSAGRVRDEEGIEPSVGVLAGEAPPELIAIEENGFKFVVDVRRGQKTGFFLDQRDNRTMLSTIAQDKSILNCFSYSGAFSVYALGGGAKEVVSLDSSRAALDLAARNLASNGFESAVRDLLKADAFTYLKECDALFDVIVLDPPSLARKRSDIDGATGGYKFLNLHALRHLRPEGILLTFSCSQHLSIDLFQKVIFGAAVDAGCKVTILKRLGQPIDHPVSLHHPEGEYLKGLVLRVLA